MCVVRVAQQVKLGGHAQYFEGNVNPRDLSWICVNPSCQQRILRDEFKAIGFNADFPQRGRHAHRLDGSETGTFSVVPDRETPDPSAA
jgi:hypothetical protein